MIQKTETDLPTDQIPFDLAAYECNDAERLQDYGEMYRIICLDPFQPNRFERAILILAARIFELTLHEAHQVEQAVQRRIAERQNLNQERAK